MGFGNYPPGVTDWDIEMLYSDEIPDWANCMNCGNCEHRKCHVHGTEVYEDSEPCDFWEDR